MNLARERALIEDARDNPESFGMLFETHYPAVFGYILKRVADPAVAQDIVAETFLKAVQNLHKFKWQDVSVANWFYKIATNEMRMYFRRNKYAPRSLDELFESDGYEPVSSEDIQAEAIEAQRSVERQQRFIEAQKLLVTLPVKYQEVIVLRFVEKKKLKEIALIIGKKEGTVKSLLSRALTKLRKELSEEEMQPNFSPGIIGSEGQLLTQPQEPYEE